MKETVNMSTNVDCFVHACTSSCAKRNGKSLARQCHCFNTGDLGVHFLVFLMLKINTTIATVLDIMLSRDVI